MRKKSIRIWYGTWVTGSIYDGPGLKEVNLPEAVTFFAIAGACIGGGDLDVSTLQHLSVSY